MKERRGNVYENKGPDFQTSERSGNFTENKGSYVLNAGMLLKRKGVIGSAAVSHADLPIAVPCLAATTAEVR